MATISPGKNTAALPADTYLIESQQLEVKIIFENEDGITYPMSMSNVLSLTIEDTLLDWFARGVLIYKNDYEFFEKNIKITPDSAQRAPYYKYRTDARDRLKIKIRPLAASDDANLPDNTWTMQYDFVIYDMQDISTGTNSTKAKKIFFWDRKYQIFNESNIEFSTAQLTKTPPLTSPSQMTDEQRSAYTGDAIKGIIKAVLGEGEKFSSTLWNRGASKINYVSSNAQNAYDDLCDIVREHVSNDSKGDIHDACVLRSDRFTNEWQLIPLHTFFELSTEGKKAGKWQLEHFFLQEQTSTTIPAVPCAPVDKSDPLNKDISLGTYSSIDGYQYVDMAGIDNASQLQSRVVHSVDHKRKTFNVEKQQHSIEETQKYFKDNYVAKLFTKSSSPQPFFQINDFKKNNISNIHTYVTIDAPEGRVAAGRNMTLKAALFLNTCISFTSRGSTHRQAGKFIAIDKQTGLNDTHFDGKLLGQWLTVSVRHIFEGNQYKNEITAVKIHSTLTSK